MRRKILTAIALLAGVLSTPAAVTVQGWWPYGELIDYYGDISGNTRRFGFAFSTGRTGNAGAGIMPFGVGGPLGTTGWVSTNCLYWTPTHDNAAGMWGPGGDPGYNPPAVNYTIECYALPEWPGTRPGNGAWLFCSGQSGGVRFVLTNDGASAMVIRAYINGNNKTIGDPVAVDTNRWTHLAVVNDNGVNTFYVNGVQHGAASDVADNTAPAGVIFAGSAPGTTPTYAGYLDELRITTFAPGTFQLSDLLLRPPGPSILTQPQSATVWTGGSAPFEIITAFDLGTTYQWRKGAVNIAGATKSIYVLPAVASTDSGSTFDCVASSGGSSVTSSVATLTVVDSNPSNIAAYRNAVQAEASLLAYFPVDNDTGTTLTNVKDATHNGTLEGPVYYDGRTNASFGLRALGFPGDGDVTVPNNPAYEFNSGFGTIEAVVRMAKPTLTDPAIVTEGDFGGLYYLVGAGKDGYSLIYSNGNEGLSWPLSQNLVGRQTHLAFVFDNITNVTPYVNGERLETKAQTSFGAYPGYSLFIGGRGANAPGYSWNGTIDEVALYSTALSQATLQTHYANLVYGTNTSAPSIVSISPSKTLLAGGSPTLKVVAAGTPPLTYQWTSNNVAIAGATAPTLTLADATTSFSADYRVTIVNSFGTKTSDPIGLTFVAPPTAYAGAVLSDHPLAYWRQSEASGASTLVDSSGFFDGTYSGSVALGTPGVFTSDTAATYNGGKGSVPWSSVLNPSGAFSLEMWVKSTDNGGYRTMISSQNRANGRSGYALYHHVNDTAFEVHMGNATTVTMFLYGPSPVELNTWYHVVLTYDGTTGKLYVDGALGPDGSASGAFNPNTAQALTFGQRTDGAWADVGQLIDEVAFYNYALTPQQITNHWQFNWSAATITQQPVGVATNEWATITLTGAASGLPNTYQWTKNGTPLVAVNNPDGSAHYPDGVASTTLTIAQVHPADAGQYRLVANNPVGSATSDPATVSVTSDTTPPDVTFAAGLGTPDPYGTKTPFLVKVSFTERIDTNTAPSSFTLDGGVTVSQVTLSSDWYSAFLSTSGLVPGQKYNLVVNGVKDQAQTPNSLTGKTVAFVAPVLTKGALVWDYYYPVSPQGVATLVGLPTYPLAPNTNVTLTKFDSGQFTGGDLNNVPGFGALGDNYGASVSGWITPTVTTNYIFFLASDDASQLWLSYDDNPTTAALIAEEATCCHGFQDPGNPTTSMPTPLEAGKRYFIRALMTEGGGGDYVKVAWKMEGDTNAAATLQPISGDVLSAYAPVPPAKFATPTYNPTTGQLTITWTGTGVIEQSADLKTWAPVTGNPTSPYTVNVGGASHLFYRIRQ